MTLPVVGIKAQTFWFKHILFRRKGLGVAYNATMPRPFDTESNALSTRPYAPINEAKTSKISTRIFHCDSTTYL